MSSRHWQDFTMLGPVLSPTQFKVLWTPFLNLVHSCTDSAITQSAEAYTRKKKNPAKIYLVSVAWAKEAVLAKIKFFSPFCSYYICVYIRAFAGIAEKKITASWQGYADNFF